MTTTEHQTKWYEREDVVAERGPYARYSMYTAEGNEACAAEVAKIVAEVEAGQLTRRTLRARYNAGMDAIEAAGFPEVHDTEPEWAIADEINERICQPQGWLEFDRWGDNERW